MKKIVLILFEEWDSELERNIKKSIETKCKSQINDSKRTEASYFSQIVY